MPVEEVCIDEFALHMEYALQGKTSVPLLLKFICHARLG